jgi:hypothetical protein
MTSQVTTLVSTVAVNEVEQVVITDIVPPGSVGAPYVRSIKIYGTPEGVNGDPVLILQISSAIDTKIAIHAPETSF